MARLMLMLSLIPLLFLILLSTQEATSAARALVETVDVSYGALLPILT